MEDSLAIEAKNIHDNQQLFETIVDNILGGVQIRKLDDRGTLLYVNRGFTTITGYTQEDIATSFDGKFFSLIHADDREHIGMKIMEQLHADGQFSVEYRMLHQNNNIIWILDKGSYLVEDDDTQIIQSILTDITEQKNQEIALRISEKRYEIALHSSGLTMFEYNILTKELILFENIAKMYGVETVIPNGAETFVKQGIIEPGSADAYYEMYQQIHAGIPFAQCCINSRDVNGTIHYFQLMMTNVFDDIGRPIRAIGVRKNISQMIQLQKENEFIKTLMATKTLFLEADLSKNKLLHLHTAWAEKNDIQPYCTYTDLVQIFVKRAVFSDHQTTVRTKLSIASLIKNFENGEHLITFNFKSNHLDHTYIWYTCTLNIIKDLATGNIAMRLYYENIHENKLKKQQTYKERNFYETMVNKALFSYEMNITKNYFLKGHERWHALYQFPKTAVYDTLLSEFAKKALHPEDMDNFLNTFERKKIYKYFHDGKRQISCEYRKHNKDKAYQWVKSTLHLYKDFESKDIKGFMYVEDIDEQKRAAILLKYNAEHDMMTDLYNKAALHEKIKAYLNDPTEKKLIHAFFMIDIDYFKNINDTFGHIYGDEVLKEIAQKLRSIFREDDLIGRCGGDEFCIFMKNIPSETILEMKANAICKSIKKQYTFEDKSSAISASIGIATYDNHGKSYEELYNAADIALYKAKQLGRNCYVVYSSNKK